VEHAPELLEGRVLGENLTDPPVRFAGDSYDGVVATLPRSQPCAEGVDARDFVAFLDAVERSGIELHSLMVLRHGHVVAEGWWAPYTADRPQLLYSLSKSFTSMAVGLAIDQGLVSVNGSLLMHLADFSPADVNERVGAITVDDALRMATGHLEDPIYSVISWCAQHDDPEWLRAFFALPPERAPGTVFAYNNMATYALARMVQQATGQRLVDYLGPRLFEPLGITERLWMTDAGGHDWGFSGLHLRTESLAACGQLWLQGGRWQGRQLVPAEWLQTATSALLPTDAVNRGDPKAKPEPDWAAGYGYQFWQSRHGYRGDGGYGQFCLVLPEQDAVVVLTAATERMQKLLELVWQHLLPALASPATLSEANRASMAPVPADVELANRLAGLALPAPTTTDRRARPGRFTPGRESGVARVTAILLREVGPDFALDLSLDGVVHTMPVGEGRWLDGQWPTDPPIPFLSAGGWNRGRFVTELRMIQTPHLLQIVLDPATGRFDSRWREPPLHVPDHTVYAV
jgi:CubicO group peptidase (beta-lactamase class C family)